MKYLLRTVMMCLLVIMPVVANACWSKQERRDIEGFSELANKLVLSFRDAVTCQPVDAATVRLGKLEYRTDASGNLELPMQPFAAQMDARIPIIVERDGYITLETKLVVAAGTVLNRRQVMSRGLSPGKLRFILSWLDEPVDLDLHLKGPGFHISYRNMKFAPDHARLDHDELDGWGPETITLERIRDGASYDVYVNNYSGDNVFSGSEQVAVYRGNRRIKLVELRPGSHDAVHVMTLTDKDHSLINRPSSLP